MQERAKSKSASEGNDQSSMSFEAAATAGPLLPDWNVLEA